MKTSHFSDITHFKLEKELKVPHQNTFESSNPKFREMNNKILKVVTRSNL